MEDKVIEFLQKRGCPKKLVNGGVQGLLDAWESFINEVEREYQLSLDDYLDDVDVRQIISELPVPLTAGHETRLMALDNRFKAATGETRKCVWGKNAAQDEGWSEDRNWWYYRVPLNPGSDLQIELLQSGLTLISDYMIDTD